MGHCTSCAAPRRGLNRGHDDLPFILYGGPPYNVYSSGYADLLGEVATPAEAAALVVRHLPPNVVMESGEVPVLGD
ncbi:hypothetical protein StrepF001_43550 [Streptomyces sp. F001]|nr:hypothetical protein StrepF001_43550 [Streptomyces sp. F001]